MKILPRLSILVIFVLFFAAFFGFSSRTVFADNHIPPTPTPTTPSSLQINEPKPGVLPSSWIVDSEVTAIGKNAARAGLFLDWALLNYDWSYVQPGSSNPLIPFWITIRNIVYAMLFLVVIVGAIVLIVTRGRSISIRRFIPRFILVAILVTFSFSFVEVLYQIVDAFQGFFIRPGGVPISQKNLLFVGWSYDAFVGLRALGDANYESAFVSLILVKLTSFTYYAMVGILLVRKIILWFFIMVSPFFALLLFFYPLRNTAKIWLGEFFRWLLYAPLFAIFLSGLVSLWRSSIPLLFNFTSAQTGETVFPTTVSILLGGPMQKVGIANSINLADTFGLYLVAIIMLWMVIIFPFILLQIFLDYVSSVNLNNTAFSRQMLGIINKFPPQSPLGMPPSPSVGGSGLSRSFPFLKNFSIPKSTSDAGLAREIPVSKTSSTFFNKQVSEKQKEKISEIIASSVPTIRDIAKYESSRISKNNEKSKEVEKIKEMLERISDQENISSTSDKSSYKEIRDKLIREKESGNPIANNILQAAKLNKTNNINAVSNKTSIENIANNISNPSQITNQKEKERFIQLREKIISEKNSGNQFAAFMLQSLNNASKSSSVVEKKEELEKLHKEIGESAKKGNPVAKEVADMISAGNKISEDIVLPQTNRIQQVSFDDYETVKKMWIENYQHLDKTGNISDDISKKAWIEDDIKSIDETIGLLSSSEKEKIEEGMNRVSDILPFLLIGGFSQSEIVSYLKAKQEAAKTVLVEVSESKSEEVFVDRSVSSASSHPQSQTASANLSGQDFSSVSSKTYIASVNDKEVVIKDSEKNNSSINALRLANISIPDIRTIARYDRSIYANATKNEREMSKIQKILSNIINPSEISDSEQKKKFLDINETLKKESERGSSLAASIFNASSVLSSVYFEQNIKNILGLQKLLEKLAKIESLDSKEKNSFETTLQALNYQKEQQNAKAIEVLGVISSGRYKHLSDVLNLYKSLSSGFEGEDQLSTEIIKKMQSVSSDEYREDLKDILKIKTFVDTVLNNYVNSGLDSSLINETKSLVSRSREDISPFAKQLSLALESKEKDIVSPRNILIYDYLKLHKNDNDSFLNSFIDHISRLPEASLDISLGGDVLGESIRGMIHSLSANNSSRNIYDYIRENNLDENEFVKKIMGNIDKKTNESINSFINVLKNISVPESIHDGEEKKFYTEFKNDLQKSIKNQDSISSDIILVSNMLTNKSLDSSSKMLFAVILWRSLLDQKDNELARIILQRVEKEKRKYYIHEVILRFFKAFNKNESVIDSEDIKKYKDIYLTIKRKSEEGNEFCKKIIEDSLGNSESKIDIKAVGALEDLIDDYCSKNDEIAKKITEFINSEKENDEVFAVQEVLKNISDIENIKTDKQQYLKLLEVLNSEAANENAYAMSVLSAVQIIKERGEDVVESKKVKDVLTNIKGDLSDLFLKAVLREEKIREQVHELKTLLENIKNIESISQNDKKTKIEELNNEIKAGSSIGDSVSVAMRSCLDDESLLTLPTPENYQRLENLLIKIKEHSDSRSAQKILDLIMQQIFEKDAAILMDIFRKIYEGKDTEYQQLKDKIISTQKQNPLSDFIMNISKIILKENLEENDAVEISKLFLENIYKEYMRGNEVAKIIIDKSNILKIQDTKDIEEEILEESEKGNEVAKTIVKISEEGSIARDGIVVPSKNRIQDVSIDDYESVRSMWEEGYMTLEVPDTLTGEKLSRAEWIKNDISKIEKTIALLSSENNEDVKAGMKEVVSILPFLLIGGFSLEEVIMYLKSKMQAGREVISQLDNSSENQEIKSRTINNSEKSSEESLDQ